MAWIRKQALPLFISTFLLYVVCQLILVVLQLQLNVYDDVTPDGTSRPVGFTEVIENTINHEVTRKTTPKNPIFDGILEKYKDFTRVDNVTVEAHSYTVASYFYNGPKGNVVRVLTLAMRQNRLDPSMCQLYSAKNKKEPLSMNIMDGYVTFAETTRQDVPEHHNKKYGAAYFTCNVPHNLKPVGVSLTSERCDNPSNFLPIIYPEDIKWEFTVCVTPLNYRYSKAYELVEMIEMNRILGADHFVFYNYSTHENVDRVLQYYIDRGIVDVVQWHLPMKVDIWPKVKGHTVEIHYFGQLGALNDCLYRNRYKSKYLVYQDLDEFIFPYKHKNWSEMISSLPSRGVYMFRNTFFRKDWNDTEAEFEGKDLARKYKAVTLLKTVREAKIFGLRHRSKYIINPRRVETVGIHNIWKERSGSSTMNVSPDIALLHHYRDWLNPNEKVKKMDDQIALKFKDELLKGLDTTWRALKDVPLGPLGY